jgi:succinate-semialdehyde dehydrogenase/glutarate-semialdehyde dehydrogenase
MSEISVINPATEKIGGRYQLMSHQEVESIIQKMDLAQKYWSKTPFFERTQCLLNMAKLLRADQQKYATLMTNEMGKPITQALSEIEKCATLFDYYAVEGERFLEPEIIKTDFYKSLRSFHPLGIIFAIMPWNFPYWQVMRFAAPNLMLGNAGLLKHAPNSMGTALAIEQLFLKAGFPENLFRSLIIDVDLCPFIIHHQKIAGVTLTGSNRAGQSVAKEAGMALKKSVLELGGSDPYIILPDANIELAAEQCVISRLGINTGQSCISAKRLIVVNKIKDEFEKRVIEKAKRYEIGDPHDPKTNLGPMAREDLRTKLHDQVQRSIRKGARCVLGGKIPEGKGYFYPATVLLDVTKDSPAFHEELFGPVICIISAKDEEDAFNLANNTDFGLGGAIFTQDIEKGEALAMNRLEAGTCAVNIFVSSNPRLPFGGIKQSGYGRELSREGMHEFANIKTVIVNKSF